MTAIEIIDQELATLTDERERRRVASDEAHARALEVTNAFFDIDRRYQALHRARGILQELKDAEGTRA